MFRPVPMAWIDLLVDRDAAGAAVQALGEMGNIELRRHDRELPFADTSDTSVGSRIDSLTRGLREWEEFLPAGDPNAVDEADAELTSNAILPALEQRFTHWRTEARPSAEELRGTRVQLAELAVLARCLAVLPDEGLGLELFATGPTRRFEPFIALGPLKSNAPPDHGDIDVVCTSYGSSPAEPRAASVVVGVVDATRREDLERCYHEQGMRFARVPHSLRGSLADARTRLQALIADAAHLERELCAGLDEVNTRTRIAGAVWLLDRHRWIHEVLRDALTGTRFVWLAGWIPADCYSALVTGLRRRRIPFLARSGAAAGHGDPPVQLRNPVWVRRFETFVRGFGMPCPDESDPSAVLAVIAPLMFGYMFGDVGHGILLMLAGWLGRRRVVALGLLVPAGISATTFGFVYGSIFCNEHLLPALWMRPLDNPLLTLAVPLGFGMLVLTIGMLLAAAQAMWSGRLGGWAARRMPLLVAYLSVPLAAVWHDGAVAAAGLAGVGFLGGIAWQVRATPGIGRTAGAIAAAVAELVENGLQLAINTLSFARLGAFALAHAGLSSAVVTLSTIPESHLFAAMLFVAGNIVVVALEGLVVSIQTARLIMFEFFRRFLTGQGQPFRPLHLPQRLDPSELGAAPLHSP